MKPDSFNFANINTPKKAGLALKRIRKMKNISQVELAKMMNMRQSTISDVESGKGTLESFFKIIQALRVNLEISSSPSAGSSLKAKSKVKTMLSYLDEE